MTRALLLVLLLVTNLASGYAEGEATLTVVTYNVRKAGLDRGALSWESRRPGALEILTEAEADLVGLQEAAVVQRRDLEGLGLACVGCGADFSNRNAILFDESRLVLVESGVFWLSETPQVPFSVSWGNEGWPRWVTWAQFRLRDAGSESRRFVVYNTHLDHRAPQSRLPSLELILEHAARHAGQLPLLLLGDFNARPNRQVVRLLMEANSAYPHLPLNDVLAQAGASRYEVTYRSFVNPAEAARLDYIFASQEFGYREAEVMTHDSRWESPPSDHHPVRAVLTLRDER